MCVKMETDTPKKRKLDDAIALENTTNKRGKFKRNDVTLTDKKRLLKEYDKLPKMSKYKVADVLGIKSPFLHNLLNSREKIMSQVHNKHIKQMRNGVNVQVEEATVRSYVSHVVLRSIIVRHPVLSSLPSDLSLSHRRFSSYRLVTNIGYCDYFALVPR